MAKKLAWIAGKRGFLFAASVVASVVSAKLGYYGNHGFFDGH